MINHLNKWTKRGNIGWSNRKMNKKKTEYTSEWVNSCDGIIAPFGLPWKRIQQEYWSRQPTLLVIIIWKIGFWIRNYGFRDCSSLWCGFWGAGAQETLVNNIIRRTKWSTVCNVIARPWFCFLLCAPDEAIFPLCSYFFGI